MEDTNIEKKYRLNSKKNINTPIHIKRRMNSTSNIEQRIPSNSTSSMYITSTPNNPNQNELTKW